MRVEGFCYNATLRPDHVALVTQSEKESSLFDHVERWLARMPFLKNNGFDFVSLYQGAAQTAHAAERIALRTDPNLDERSRDKQLRALEGAIRKFDILFDPERWQESIDEGPRRLSYDAFVSALFITLYRDEPILQRPFEVLTALIAIDESLTNWRQRHALLAHRMLGRHTGTAGSGYAYLEETARRHKVFGDLFDIPTFFLPRATRPALPDEVLSKLDFRLEQ